MSQNITLNSLVVDSATGRKARVIAVGVRGLTIRFADFSALYLLDSQVQTRLTLAR